MFKHCLRCGHGWLGPTGESCGICSGITDQQAKYIKDMREDVIALRRIARKAIYAAASSGSDMTQFNTNDLSRVGIYVAD